VRAALPRVVVLAGAEASARSLRALARTGALSRFRVLHFATHTQVEPARLLESALVLAPDRPGEGESRLSAREIADTWRLDADLVCLTGCQTALGMRAAGQGLLGLQQAFFRAGARSVLVSLWPVDDAATALLMKEFYGRLARATGPGARAEALRQAQRAVRDWRAPGGARPYAHPAYWAGFTLVGDAG
jgi:CHAT domain-containing protein